MLTDAKGYLLVVDDNEMNRDVLSRRLQRQNFEVALAHDGEEALAMLRAQSFDLVLLDIMMPKMNGFEVLEILQADAHLRHIPVIVISAVDELESVVKCIELGAEDFLFKPFNPVLLKARVNATLQKRLLHKQALELPDRMRASAGIILEKLDALVALDDSTLNDRQQRLIDDIRTVVTDFAGSVPDTDK